MIDLIVFLGAFLFLFGSSGVLVENRKKMPATLVEQLYRLFNKTSLVVIIAALFFGCLFIFFGIDLSGLFSGFFFIIGIFSLMFSLISFIVLKRIKLNLIIYYLCIVGGAIIFSLPVLII